jgi:two-component system, LytTR family, response regulator
MQKIKVVHVDDQQRQLNVVKTILADFADVELLAQFTSADNAKNYIEANDTDLVIADVEMPDKSGLWLANEIKNNKALIVFLTAHPQYTLQAFEACAIHYLLKPVSTEGLKEVFNRFEKFNALKKTRKIFSMKRLMSWWKITLIGHHILKGYSLIICIKHLC